MSENKAMPIDVVGVTTNGNVGTVDDYIAMVPAAARPHFDDLRRVVIATLSHASEVRSYGIVRYKIDSKRTRVFISGWKDHVALYPVPHDEILREELKPHIKGKGTLWFVLDTPLPAALFVKVVKELAR